MVAVGRRCVYLGVRWGWGMGSGYRYWIVCMTCRCWGGSSTLCAVEGWVLDCGGGVENFFLLAWWKQVCRASWAVDLGICKHSVFCERRRSKCREWPWDIVKMYVVLLTELCWRRNSTGCVANFPLGRERHFVARRVKTGGGWPPGVWQRELSDVFT